MKRDRKSNRCHGITLMITMMALVILATVIVQFQVDMSLNIRAGSYRRDRLQCRYGAESAMASASVLIREITKKKEDESPQTNEQNSSTAAVTNPDDTGDPNSTQDPNEAGDPNDVLILPTRLYVIAEQHMKIGETEVDIQIHDESAKWPMLWLFTSPFHESVGKEADAKLLLTRYGELLQKNVDQSSIQTFMEGWDATNGGAEVSEDTPPSQFDLNKATEATLTLADKLGDQLDLPAAGFMVHKVRSSRGTRYQMRSRRNYRPPERERDKTRQNAQMGLFASRWYHALRSDPAYRQLTEPLPNQPESFSDFMGVWGNNSININTASAELITSVFEPLGMTEEIAQAIVDYRQSNPFTQTSQLMNVPGVDKEVLTAIKDLCVTTSKNYSIHVIARLGRVTHKLIGGCYIDDKKKVRITTVISGE